MEVLGLHYLADSLAKLRGSTRTNRVVFSAWITIVIVGQCVLNVEVRTIEILAVAWLFVGIVLVSRTACLPLIILTCPVFMCEIQRPWAWVQLVAVFLLLARLLVEERFTRVQYLWIALVGALVLALSWPAEAPELLVNLANYSKKEILGQWFHAHATWSIFSFRQAFDRALIGMVCTAVLLSGRYFSSHRLWSAFRLCGVMMLVAALSATLVPWQKPHVFLGTTNFGAYSNFKLHGAGYNPMYFTTGVMLMIPWLFIPFDTRRKWLYIGILGLLFPLPYVYQRILFVALPSIALTLTAFLIASLSSARGRRKFLARYAWPLRTWGMAFLTFGICSAISAMWYSEAGLVRFSSLLHREPKAVEEVQEQHVQESSSSGKQKNIRHEHTANGIDVWFGDGEVLQGVLTFSQESTLWSDMRAGTIITISEDVSIQDANGIDVVQGTDVSFAPEREDWHLHISTLQEATNEMPLVLSEHNIANGTDGMFVVDHHEWELTIVDNAGSPVFGPVGQAKPSWNSGNISWEQAGRLEADPSIFVTPAQFHDAKSSTFGLPNMWGDATNTQDFSILRASRMNTAGPALILNEFNAVAPDRYLDKDGVDACFGRVQGNGGNWIELVVVRDDVDLRGWQLRWASLDPTPPKQVVDIDDTDLWNRIRRWIKRSDRSRYFMWQLGIARIKERHMLRGAGAGTWARFHRANRYGMEWYVPDSGKPTRRLMNYHSHMHNTYLDAVFEYGLVIVLMALAMIAFAFSRIAFGRRFPSRLWALYIVVIAVNGLGQHLLHAFAHLCLLMPLVILTAKVVLKGYRRTSCRAHHGLSEQGVEP